MYSKYGKHDDSEDSQVYMLSDDEEVKGIRQKPIHMFKNYSEICSQSILIDKKIYKDLDF
jgi:hypothetical protein